MDGKHVMLQAPAHSGSQYFNYKAYHSIVLFAMVDAEYNFTFADVGCQGRISDAGIFKDTVISNKLKDHSLCLPDMAPLPGRTRKVPYVILGDEAFGLTNNIMKPYPGTHRKGSQERTYNYRHCRARRVVENAFGILSVVFRVLRKPMLLYPEKAALVVLCTVYLHNYMRKNTSAEMYSPRGEFDSHDGSSLVEGNWRRDITSAPTSFFNLNRSQRNCCTSAKGIRDEFSQYFLSEGRLSYQNEYC